MQKLIEQILKISNVNKKIKIKSYLGDGSYNSNENFKFLREKDSTCNQSEKKLCVVISKNNKPRNKEVILQQLFDKMEKETKIWI